MQKIEICQMENLHGGDCDMAAGFMYSVGTGAMFIPGFQVIAVLGLGIGALMTATNCGYGKPH
ncbi:hypothetical protein [Larkinella punicea]|uniref:Bacteriocin n=1 Tax=Larkinella punicea TaxID=2315727 RepID=A0A368JS83_9BACT|nr:hypothetical protein [Larkinella punicea]RCR70195.1 hypothetical protein DUE52_07470 [Larkinella punicea]